LDATMVAGAALARPSTVGVKFPRSLNIHNFFKGVNPSNGKVIARVKGASKAEYESTISAMLKVKDQWQTTPAPRRGDIVREIGMELRKHKVTKNHLLRLHRSRIFCFRKR
jgi:acyl-CoA reductase-like NAD-dependent aldehyde dehydrogenase